MRTNHRLTVATAVWAAACVGACVVDRPSAPAFWAALVVTLSLVTANLVSAAGSGKRRLARVGRVALAVGLYALVFPTSHALLGPGHFAVPPEAGPGGWAVFTLAHLLRAADAIDLLDFWGHPIQSVRHTSPLAAGLLVGFHLLTGAFVIEGAVRAAARAQKAVFGNDVLRSIQLKLVMYVAFSCVVLCSAAFLAVSIGGLLSPPPGGYEWPLSLGLAAGAALSWKVCVVTGSRLKIDVFNVLDGAGISGTRVPDPASDPHVRRHDDVLDPVERRRRDRDSVRPRSAGRLQSFASYLILSGATSVSIAFVMVVIPICFIVTLQPPEQVLRFSAGSRESRACPPWPRSWTTPSSRPSAPAP